MRWFDGHLDLTYLALHGRDLRKEVGECHGSLQPASVTFPSLRAGGVRAAVSTIFVRKRGGGVEGEFCFEDEQGAFAAGLKQVEMHREWEREGWIRNAKRSDERGTRNEERLSVMLALEGAGCLRRVEDLDFFYGAGVRMVSLAWAEGSKWAGGDQSGGDVTAEGRELIKRLDELGVVHDVSHLSERAFWTVMELAKGPVVASHSNCRALLPGSRWPERHLSDEQVREIVTKHQGTGRRRDTQEFGGGKIGICLFARFLVGAEELKRRRARVSDVIGHIRHMEDLVGRRDFLALGSDMDSGFGTELLPVDLQGPGDLWRLAEALSAAGWSDQEIERFAWGWESIGDGI